MTDVKDERRAKCVKCRNEWTVSKDDDFETATVQCPKCHLAQSFGDAHQYKEESKKEKKEVCTFHLRDDHICEQISDNGVPKFVKWYRPSSECRYEIVSECCGYVPRTDRVLTAKMVRLPGRPIQCDSIIDILGDIGRIGDCILDTRDPETLQLQIRLCLSSWFLDSFYRNEKLLEKVAPLVTVEGGSGTGKKRWYTFLRAISYRPVHILKGNTVPSIVRTVEPWNASLFVNEADMANSDSENDLVQLYNGRYDGEPIPKYNAETREVDVLKSFGLTALALRRQPRDEGIVSRRINLESVEAQKDVPEIVDEKFFDETQTIQDRMLFLRLKYFDMIKFDNRSGLPVDDNWRVKEVLVVYKILGQIDQAALQDLKELSARMTAKQVRDNSNTWDGAILNIVYSFVTDEDAVFRPFRGKGVTPLKMIETTDKERNPDEKEIPLTSKLIADQLKTTSTEITRCLRPHKVEVQLDRINGKVRRVLVITDPKYLARMFKKYVVEFDADKLKEMLMEHATEQHTIEEESMKGDTKGSVTSVASVTEMPENKGFATGATVVTPPGVSDGVSGSEPVFGAISEILKAARGEFVEQSPERITASLKGYGCDVSIGEVKAACDRLVEHGMLKTRNGKYAFVGGTA